MSKNSTTIIKAVRGASQAGFTMLEALVGMSFAGMLSLAIAMSLTAAMRTEKATEVHFAASTIASNRIEQISSVDVQNITSAYNETDTEVSWGDLNVTFLRSTTITTNSDGSRTIKVSVRSDHSLLPSDVSFQTTLALWE
jgi:type II secretory pathway pseudopilin PulG